MVIRGGDWSYTDLRGIECYKMELDHINFEHADLRECLIEKCSMRYCNFRHALMSGTVLKESDLRDSVLDGVDLLGIRFCSVSIDLEQSAAISAALGANVVF